MTTIRELSEAIAAQLADITSVRVHAFAPDPFQPPGIVVQPPSVIWDTPDRTFGCRQFEVGVAVAVARTSEKAAQDELDSILTAIEARLGEDPTLGGVAQFSRLVDARPTVIPASGTDYPGYVINLQVIA